MKHFTSVVAGLALTGALAATPALAQEGYQPTPENVAARQQFAANKFGIFLHWGIYSMFGQGEWYLQSNYIHKDEYAKAARGFYPAYFDAAQWVSAFKQAGARYICFTTRHHDGFSMFDTQYSDYDIVDATPFKRDIVRELTDECCLFLPVTKKVKAAVTFDGHRPVKFQQNKEGLLLSVGEVPDVADYIIELTMAD